MFRTFILMYVITLIVLGLICPLLHKIGIGIGKLPGDIVIKKERVIFYIPIVSSLLIIVVLTFLLLVTGQAKF